MKTNQMSQKYLKSMFPTLTATPKSANPFETQLSLKESLKTNIEIASPKAQSKKKSIRAQTKRKRQESQKKLNFTSNSIEIPKHKQKRKKADESQDEGILFLNKLIHIESSTIPEAITSPKSNTTLQDMSCTKADESEQLLVRKQEELNIVPNTTPKISKRSAQLLKSIQSNREEVKASSLSASSIKLLKSLKQKQDSLDIKPKIQDKINISMHEKYEEVLEGKLQLPSHYKLLMKLFEALDLTLNFFKQRKQQISVFDDIKKSIESTYGRKFELASLQRILYVVPEFYTYKWEKLTSSHEYKLVIYFELDIQSVYQYEKDHPISIPFKKLDKQTSYVCDLLTKEQLDKRREIFEKRLLRLTYVHHQTILSQLFNNQQITFDPITENNWHHMVDIQSAPSIPLQRLSDQPQLSRGRCSLENNISNYVKSASAAASRSITPVQQKNDKILKPEDVKDRLGGISVNLLRQIKEQDRFQKESQEIMQSLQQQDEGRKSIELQLKICEIVKSLFQFTKQRSINIVKVIDQITDSQKGIYQSKMDIINALHEIVRLNSSWIKINQTTKGQFVQELNTLLTLNQIQQNIK